MNYQHAYHAGAVADVFKHIVLIQLLLALQKKSSAFSYIDTHAGKALYDLTGNPAQKTQEYKQGIYQLWQNKNALDPIVAEYLKTISYFNPDNNLKLYPGSSLIARQYLRAQDEAILCELHPAVYQDLHHFFYHDKQVHVHYRDGYEALAALIPPRTKRGLVLIDPPFEVKDEFSQIIKLLQKAHQRWPTGIYAIWFPIKEYHLILDFYQQLKSCGFPKILATEFWTEKDNSDKALKGSGLAIINPPWQFDTFLSNRMILKNNRLHTIWL